MLPGGRGGGRGLALIVLIVVAVWAASGFYRVQPDEQGVVLRFGEWVATTQPGLNYHLPVPIESVDTPKVTRVNQIQVGYRNAGEFGRAQTTRDVPEESLMLTGDENIVDIDFAMFWVIKDAGQFLFNVQNPEETAKAAAESAMREVIGNKPIGDALAQDKEAIENSVRALTQEILDSYEAGILIQQARLQKVDPPSAVIDAFRDVQAAEQERDRLERQADAYANRVLAGARGEAAQVLEVAESYRAQVVNEAKGEASRFSAVLAEYRLAPEVTRRRLYIETLEKVLGGIDKIILDEGVNDGSGQGVVPYLPLNELRRGTTTPEGGN
jgi:membrane protease subunit HflK